MRSAVNINGLYFPFIWILLFLALCLYRQEVWPNQTGPSCTVSPGKWKRWTMRFSTHPAPSSSLRLKTGNGQSWWVKLVWSDPVRRVSLIALILISTTPFSFRVWWCLFWLTTLHILQCWSFNFKSLGGVITVCHEGLSCFIHISKLLCLHYFILLLIKFNSGTVFLVTLVNISKLSVYTFCPWFTWVQVPALLCHVKMYFFATVLKMDKNTLH